MSTEEGCYPVHDDPVVQLLTVMARSLRDWPPKPQAEGEWDPAPFLPGGSRYIPKLTTYSTYYSPITFLPIKSAEEIAAEERADGARKALAVLRELPTARSGPTLAGKPCPVCAFRLKPSLPPYAFKLPPFEPYEPMGDRLSYRIEFYGVNRATQPFRLSGIV